MQSFTHPTIEHIERTGYPYKMREENVLLGQCVECGKYIYSEFCGDALRTNSGLMFCRRECSDKYFGISEVDN